ncbi:ph-response sensor protein [Elasticomyces elasticus]|nr:ph-response sensor protein [Elasticomyces elasticus]
MSMLSTSPTLSPPRALSSGRRLISKIASPFASKTRAFTEYDVQLDEPHRQYSPGDIVRGCVVLRVVKPVRVTHIVVCLHGFVQVFKTPGFAGDGYRHHYGYQGTGKGKRSGGEYFGNGFASLFEDEVVLCGDGRLGESLYKFNFELEFPIKPLPSSIDFERGTITYLITSTMTRPTTISPVSTCDRKIHFVERIDISCLRPPKSRSITLEAISKRSRARHHARKLVPASDVAGKKSETSTIDPRTAHRASAAPSMVAGQDLPESPAPSESSFDSGEGSSRLASTSDSGPHSTHTSDSGNGSAGKDLHDQKTITATVELLRGGCLRGDSIPVKVVVNHTKHVKSLNGVIVTFFRLARVDMHPDLPVGPMDDKSRQKREDYYPKSMTGLGGLSLSGAGSSHTFRKDLSQTFMPLLVDPQSLTAEVNAKILVPEEAFPTIASVPGAMISFKYHVEVVLDIQGKLAGQDRNLPQMTYTTPPVALADGSSGSGWMDDLNRPSYGNYGSNIVDTAPVRRDKSVVTCNFEITVGTQDSDRRRGKQKVQSAQESTESDAPWTGPVRDASTSRNHAYESHGLSYEGRQYQDTAPAVDHQHRLVTEPGQAPPSFQMTLPPRFPIPDIVAEEQALPEKERLRRAEARLLPSQPPPSDGQNDSAHDFTPSAPPESAATVSANGYAQSEPPTSENRGASSAVPQYYPPSPSYETLGGTQDEDKQELHRRRLQVEASAPELDPDAQPGGPDHDGPTAPTLSDGDEDEGEGRDGSVHDSHASMRYAGGLPAYAR